MKYQTIDTKLCMNHRQYEWFNDHMQALLKADLQLQKEMRKRWELALLPRGRLRHEHGTKTFCS